MEMRGIFVAVFLIAAVLQVSAQQRTVTNQDLEKYRSARMLAEKDLRENYAKMGFPSPEELERQRIADAKALDVLSTRLRNERLERERVHVEQLQAAAAIAAADRSNEEVYAEDAPGFGGYSYDAGDGRYNHYWKANRRSYGGRYFSVQGYRATPAGMFPVNVRPYTQPAYIRRGRP